MRCAPVSGWWAPRGGGGRRLGGPHAVIAEPRGTAPDHYVAVHEPHPHRRALAGEPAEQEHRRDAEGHRDDRRRKVPFVAVLVQGQARARLVAIDQARVRLEGLVTGGRGGGARQLEERFRQRRPRPAALRIHAIVAIPRRVGDPAQRAAVRHRHGHAEAARGGHVAKGRRCGHVLERGEQGLLTGRRMTAQDDRAGAQLFPPLRGDGEQALGEQARRHRPHFASWKMMPAVRRSPERSRLTP
jgi:hypothetical protein